MNIILSPHLDDGVFNAWHVIAKGQIKIITVFAGTPDTRKTTFWDRLGGIKSSQEMMAVRRAENKTALKDEVAEIINLNFLDHQYAHKQVDIETIWKELRKHITKQDVLFVPIAASRIFRHVDHVALRDLGVHLFNEGFRVKFYTDIPYMRIPNIVNVRYLSKLERKVKIITGLESRATVVVLDNAIFAKKRAAMRAYKTQYRITNLSSFGSLSRKANIVHEIEIELNK